METKNTQLLNDTLEMTKLVLQATKANGEQLTQTDGSLNSIGKEITTLNNIAEEILAQEKEHNEVLSGIQDNQKVVYDTNASLLETASDITRVFKNNNETLTNIAETIAHGDKQDKEAKAEFIDEMSKKNDAYGENIGVLSKQLSDTTERIDELDTRDTLAKLLEQVSKVSTSVNQLETKRNESQDALLDEFQKADENIKASIESLNSLSDYADQLVATFETAVSRIQTIDMKLDALSDEGSLDELVDEEDIIETQNQNTEGE